MVRETAMRCAFMRAAVTVLSSNKPVKQARLMKRIVAKLDAGVGIRHPRSKR